VSVLALSLITFDICEDRILQEKANASCQYVLKYASMRSKIFMS